MLQRVYGTAFEKQADLDAYLKMLEEAAKRDHRKLVKNSIYSAYMKKAQASHSSIQMVW